MNMRSIIGVVILLCATGTAAGAQEGSSEPIEEIRVTGSRLIQNGNEAPTPVTVVAADDLIDIAPMNLLDGLNQLPAFGPTITPQNTGSPSGRGGNRLDLRNFGENRLLVLLDGRRHVASSSGGVVDADLLPQGLISRVDIVTGGASAAYGSNAVSGVVNFILDKDFSGFKADLKTGISEESDNEYYGVNLAFGSAFAEERGHVLLNIDYHDSQGIAGPNSNHRRDWQDARWQRVAMPSSMRPPQFRILENVNLSSAAYGGLITSGPLEGITFEPGGTPRMFQYGALDNGQYMVGGERVEVDTSFVAPLERESIFGRVSYELNNRVTLFSEVTHAETATQYRINVARQAERNNSNYTIFRDNAYLPAAIADLMDANNLTEFPLSRFSRDWGYLENVGSGELNRIVVGAEGEIGEWDFNAYYQYGDTTRNTKTLNNPIVTRVYEAADAVVGPDGAVVCRITLTHPDSGCIPTNVFGEGAASPESIDWVKGTTDYDQNNTQHVFSFEVIGDLFSGWAGPISLATGAEYRHEKISEVVDPTSSIHIEAEDVADIRGFPPGLIGQVGGYQQTNPQELSGEIKIKEVFAESVIPLVSGQPWAEAMDLNVAGRLTDYSTSGSVFSWKVGLSYQINQWLRLRATRSQDIRAASADELFTPSNESRRIVFDPLDGSSLPRNVNTVGNPTLEPEKAKTWTAGVILAPQSYDVSLSIDYWHIDLKDAISTLDAQTLVDQCFSGSQELCSLIERGSNGLISTIRLPYLNVESRVISGVDVESAYTLQLDSLSAGWPGSLSFRALAAYYETDETTVPGGDEPFNTAGGITNGVPHWKGRFSTTYTNAGFRAIVAQRYIGSGEYNSTYVVPTRISADDQSIPSRLYTDLTASYTFGAPGGDGEVELYGTITNLFDKDPPVVPTATASGNSFRGTSFALYDVIGRYFAVGVRVSY